MQTEGVLHLCLDCGYKWEDAPQTDLGEMIIYQSDIFKEGELDEKVVVRKFRITTQHGAMAGKPKAKK